MSHTALGWTLAILATAWLPELAAAQTAQTAPAAADASAPEAAAPATAGLDRVLSEQKRTDEEAKASQQRVEQIDDETQKLLAEYRKAVADAESFTAYAAQLETQIQSQTEEIASIQEQLEEIETTSRSVTPLMHEMLGTLEQFVGLDIPFLVGERANRVALLKDMMTRADVTMSEKYRRIVEAYQVEMDYGRTIEAYEGKLGDAADARTVQFLRVGRVALLYQTLDGHETGYWDAGKKNWVVDDAYAHGFKEGVAVAKKTRAPEMLLVPVPAAEEARS
jgi:hypothetical protein